MRQAALGRAVLPKARLTINDTNLVCDVPFSPPFSSFLPRKAGCPAFTPKAGPRSMKA